jgi:hypothetical protein
MSHQLIVAGLAGLIDEDGLTFHEAMEVLEDIKSQTFPALMEMASDNREKAGGHRVDRNT